MAITWYPPLDAPTNVVATATAGGSVPVTTWYIRVCAMSSNTYYDSAYNMRRSAPSEEISVTTTAGNQTIEFTWDAVAGAAAYNVYITEAATGDSRWRNVATGNKQGKIGTTGGSSTTTNSLTVTDNSLFAGYSMDTFASAYDLPFNFNKELGVGYLLLSGTLGTITHKDLYNAMVSAGASDYVSYGRNHFGLKSNWTIASGATGSWTALGIHFLPVKGVFVNNSTSFTMSYSNCLIDTIGWSNRHELKNATYTNCVFRAQSQTGLPYEYYLWGWDNYFNITSGFIDGGSNTFLSGNVQNGVAANITDLKILASGTYGITTSPQAGNIHLRCMGMYFMPNVANFSSTAFMREFTSTGSYDIRAHYACADHLNLLDSNFAKGARTDPVIWWSASGAYGNSYDIYQSLLIKVLDANNNPISGATITCKNADGDTNFTETTDASGVISEQKLLRAIFTYGGDTFTSIKTDKNPFTITITKSGYKPYITKQTITAKTNWTITLEKVDSLNTSKQVKGNMFL